MRHSETITSSVMRKYDRMRRSETITSSVMRKYDRMRRSETITSGAKTIKKSGAWIGAQLTILCSINRKLRSGDYKEIGVRFLCSV